MKGGGLKVGLIQQETAAILWECYREIKAAEKLLEDMEEVRKRNTGDPMAQRLCDVFGKRRVLQLGVPCGENAHRLFSISPKLAEAVIRAHIVNKQAELNELNELARSELEA